MGAKRASRDFLEALEIGRRTLVMGILNVTPDSFSDGGRFADVGSAVRHAREMIEAGADIIDVGGESTRPNAVPVSADEEMRRALPVIEALRRESDAAISIDSWKSEVAEAALQAGAVMVNDTGGLSRDPAMAAVAARHDAAVAIMHMQGTPQTMQRAPSYGDVVGEIREFLRAGVERAEAAGVRRERILVDPGIGFGKTLAHNVEILRRLRELAGLGAGVLIGVSRKSFLGEILGVGPEGRMVGGLAAVALAIREGVSMVRVHDVRETMDVVKVADVICRKAE